MKKIATLWPWLAAICSGLLCTFCFPPFDQSWFCWIALTPLIAAVWFSGENSKRRWLSALFAASAWTALEWVRGWLFGGFGWNALGVSLHNTWPLIQIAEFSGVTGLSFVVAFANIIAVTTPVRLYLEAKMREARPHFDLTLTLAGLVGLLAFGLYSVQNRRVTVPLRVAAVQADVPQQEKFDPEFSAQIFERFQRLSEIALHSNPPPALLIWPESSMPDPVRDPATGSNDFVTELSASSKTDLLLGTLDMENGKDYNAAVLISGATQEM